MCSHLVPLLRVVGWAPVDSERRGISCHWYKLLFIYFGDKRLVMCNHRTVTWWSRSQNYVPKIWAFQVTLDGRAWQRVWKLARTNVAMETKTRIPTKCRSAVLMSKRAGRFNVGPEQDGSWDVGASHCARSARYREEKSRSWRKRLLVSSSFRFRAQEVFVCLDVKSVQQKLQERSRELVRLQIWTNTERMLGPKDVSASFEVSRVTKMFPAELQLRLQVISFRKLRTDEQRVSLSYFGVLSSTL